MSVYVGVCNGGSKKEETKGGRKKGREGGRGSGLEREGERGGFRVENVDIPCQKTNTRSASRRPVVADNNTVTRDEGGGVDMT